MSSIFLQASQGGIIEKIIEIASHITNPISLIAFGIALIPVYFLFKDINDKKALKDNPQEYLRINERIQIDLDKVAEGERPPIIKQVLKGRIISQSIIAGSIIMGGLILAWIVTHVQQPKPNPVVKTDSMKVETIKTVNTNTPFLKSLDSLLLLSKNIRTRMKLYPSKVCGIEDCNWIFDAFDIVEKHIKDYNQTDLIIYLKQFDNQCGTNTLGVENEVELDAIYEASLVKFDKHVTIIEDIRKHLE